MAMTLAMLVAVMTASNSKKLPKVSCPIESGNDRIRTSSAANAGGMVIETGAPISLNIYDVFRAMVHAEPRRRFRRTAWSSIRGNAGVLDDLCPQRDLGPDDVGELRPWRGLRLASGNVEFFAHVGCGQRGLQRRADTVHHRLGRPRRHHDAEPRHHLRLGKTLLRQGRHVRKVFRTAVADRADDPDRAGLHLRHRPVSYTHLTLPTIYSV